MIKNAKLQANYLFDTEAIFEFQFRYFSNSTICHPRATRIGDIESPEVRKNFRRWPAPGAILLYIENVLGLYPWTRFPKQFIGIFLMRKGPSECATWHGKNVTPKLISRQLQPARDVPCRGRGLNGAIAGGGQLGPGVEKSAQEHFFTISRLAFRPAKTWMIRPEPAAESCCGQYSPEWCLINAESVYAVRL